MRSINKKAAVELSIGTVVILVIGMSMLILGLILVRTIFSGAVYNVETINDKVKEEIGDLFEEEGKSVVYLADNKADVDREEDWGIAFAIRNTERGTTESSNFAYEVKASNLAADCTGLTQLEAESWIKSRGTGSVTLAPGDTDYFVVRFVIPDSAPLCIVPYDIAITKDGQSYTRDFFDIVIKS